MVTFIGTKNGVVTSVAIICPPLGSAASNGLASNAYRSFDHGNRQTKMITTASTARSRRSRISIRCEMKVYSVDFMQISRRAEQPQRPWGLRQGAGLRPARNGSDPA